MNINQLLDLSLSEGKKYGKRFVKFFYHDKFYLIDRKKAEILLKFLKLDKENLLRMLLDKNILKKYKVSVSEILEIISPLESVQYSISKDRRQHQ